MKKNLFLGMAWLIGLAFLFTTCTVEENLSPVTSTDDAELTLRKNAQTPFKAYYVNEVNAHMEFPNDIPMLVLDIVGNGNGTHLGKSEMLIPVSYVWLNPPGQNSIQNGNVTFVAANGDELYAYFSGIGWLAGSPYPPGSFFFEGSFIFGKWLADPLACMLSGGGEEIGLEDCDLIVKDGTGRFAGATGYGTYVGGPIETNEGWRKEITWEGVLIDP